jgi:toxin ParE1/3/4
MTTRAVLLSPLAEDDLSGIAAWTAAQYGDRQATAYVDAIISTIEELATHDLHPRSKERDEIALGLRSLHMAKRGRRGRHLILYQEGQDAVTILRILHDSMELSRHLPGHEE